VTDPTTLTIEFELTPEEWVETVLAHLRKDRDTRKTTRVGQLLLGFILAMLSLSALLGGSLYEIPYLVAAFSFAILAFPVTVRFLNKRQLGRMARRGTSNGTFGPHRIRLTPEGMLDETTGYSLLTRWSAIERVDQSEHVLMVYLGPQAFVPIPVSAFRDSDQLRRFSDRFFTEVNAAKGSTTTLPPVTERGTPPSGADVPSRTG